MRSTRSSAGASLPAPRLASSPASLGWTRSWTRSADRLAAYAGLVPAARDSGKRVGNHRKGRGGNRVLKRVFYQSAFSSMRAVPESRAFYDRKRREGKRHAQAVIALARRRVNVLWAMLRDGATFEARSAA
jgi:transposase